MCWTVSWPKAGPVHFHFTDLNRKDVSTVQQRVRPFTLKQTTWTHQFYQHTSADWVETDLLLWHPHLSNVNQTEYKTEINVFCKKNKSNFLFDICASILLPNHLVLKLIKLSLFFSMVQKKTLVSFSLIWREQKHFSALVASNSRCFSDSLQSSAEIETSQHLNLQY